MKWKLLALVSICAALPVQANAQGRASDRLTKVEMFALQQEMRDRGCGNKHAPGVMNAETRRAIVVCKQRLGMTGSARDLLAAFNNGFAANDSPPLGRNDRAQVVGELETHPVAAAESTKPAIPATPARPATPATPARPATPATPARPATPATPARPATPATPARSATPVIPASAQGRTVGLQPESRVWFEGTSTVKAFSCSATAVEGQITTDPSALASDPERLVSKARISIPVSALDCRNGTMNNHMRKALKAQTAPLITWRMSSYRVAGDSVFIGGHLNIAGRENQLELRASGTTTGGIVRVKGSKQLRMTDFGVTPPSLMLGTMKVRDPVVVKFDVSLKP